MNYRHAYHAGNFADVVKHVVLTRILQYLKLKDKAFRVIDTHAGTGFYDLSSPQAQKTGEWREGIGRLIDAGFSPEVADLLKPLLDAVRAANPGGGLQFYPGSPAITRHLLRKQDRLSAIELHAEDAATLKKRFAGDFQTRIIELDGWLALGSHVPPKEKRGLVLIDPPFEQEGEFERLIDGLVKAHRRWPGGIYALWYPLKDRAAVKKFHAGLQATAIARILDISFSIRAASPQPRLDGSGMIVVNPPWSLPQELQLLLPALKPVLAQAPEAGWAMEWIAGEAVKAGKSL